MDARDWGAVGDGVADDADALDAYIAHLVSNSSQTAILDLGPGRFRISRSLRVHNQPYRTTIHIRGAGRPYRGNIPPYGGTTIDATGIMDGPAISLHGVLSARVSGLAIIGPSRAHISADGGLGSNVYTGAADDREWAAWVAPGTSGCHAAIAIDDEPGARSSIVDIEHVHIAGWTYGIANSYVGDGNGDFLTVKHATIEECASGISWGNSQARNLGFEAVHFHQCHTAWETGRIGERKGKPAISANNCSLQSVIQLWDGANAGLGSPCWRSTYGEAVYRLFDAAGGQSAKTIALDHCEFDFGLWRRLPVPAVLKSVGASIHMRNVTLSGNLPNDETPRAFVIDADPQDVIVDNLEIMCNGAPPSLAHARMITATGGLVFRGAFNNLVEGSTWKPSRAYDLDGDQIPARRIGRIQADPQQPLSIYAREQPNLGKAYRKGSVAQDGRLAVVTLINAPTWMPAEYGGDVGDLVWDDETGTAFTVISRDAMTVVLDPINNVDADGLAVTLSTNGYLRATNCRRSLT